MDCEKYAWLALEWKGKCCIFGAGKCGSTWGFELVRDAGFDIEFYVDNYKAGECCNGYPVFSFDYLKDRDDVLCFVAIIGNDKLDVIKQLNDNHISNYFLVPDEEEYLSEFAQYLRENKNYELQRKFEWLVDDEKYLMKRFEKRMGYRFDINNPITFNEKIQWLKIHDRNPLYSKLVDKVAVKEYVARIIGNDYIIPTLGIYDCFDDIVFDRLPKSFVLKCTHDSGSAIICKEKASFNLKEAREKLEKARKRNYFYLDREWPYYDVPRKIIVEKYITESESTADLDLYDYKVFTFNGAPHLIQVDFDRFKGHKRNLYTTEWKLLDASLEFPSDPKKNIPKPDCLNELLDISGRLAAHTKHCRCDFYISGGKLYFGEMTFYHGSGCEHFHPPELDRYLGSLINLESGEWEEKGK